MDKIGPHHKMCRRVGEALCGRPNCPSNKRPYPPGQHGRGRKRISEYQTRLVEKQKLRHIYGVSEKQMRRYFKRATRSKGVTGEELIVQLETRLDTVRAPPGLRADAPPGPPARLPRARVPRRQARRRPQRQREARPDDRGLSEGTELRVRARGPRDHARTAARTCTGTRTRCRAPSAAFPSAPRSRCRSRSTSDSSSSTTPDAEAPALNATVPQERS